MKAFVFQYTKFIKYFLVMKVTKPKGHANDAHKLGSI